VSLDERDVARPGPGRGVCASDPEALGDLPDEVTRLAGRLGNLLGTSQPASASSGWPRSSGTTCEAGSPEYVSRPSSRSVASAPPTSAERRSPRFGTMPTS